MRNELAVASLLLGIFSLCNYLGIENAALAMIFGILALREIKREENSDKHCNLGDRPRSGIYCPHHKCSTNLSHQLKL